MLRMEVCYVRHREGPARARPHALRLFGRRARRAHGVHARERGLQEGVHTAGERRLATGDVDAQGDRWPRLLPRRRAVDQDALRARSLVPLQQNRRQVGPGSDSFAPGSTAGLFFLEITVLIWYHTR